MKRTLILATILAAGLAGAQTVSLAPNVFTWTWTRQGTTAIADTNIWMSGVSYVVTGQCLVGTATQDLTSCGVILRVGDTSTNAAYAGTVLSPASAGMFSCLIQIPPLTLPLSQRPPYTTSVQLTITNGSYTVTDREQKQLQYTIPLH